MKWLLKLLGVNTGSVGELAKDIREAIKGKELDPNKQLEAATKLAELQAAINQVEVSHRTVFVAGWRPFVGWVCGLAFMYATIIEPVSRFVATMHGYAGDFPEIDTTITMQVLLGMLGMAAYRTYEKQKGTTK